MSQKVPREVRICECLCGGTFECKVTSKKRFLWGHQCRGRKNSEEEKAKRRKAHQGIRHSEETKKKIGKANSGKKRSMEEKERRRKEWQDSVFRENRVRAMFKAMKFRLRLKPNKPERFLIELLNELLPGEYKYVGDGDVIIGGKWRKRSK